MRLVGVAVAAALMALGGGAVAVTPVDSSDELAELCELAPPDVDTDDSGERSRYHRRRREAIHRIYETSLTNLSAELLGYDRVAGLLTVSGFRTHQLREGGPAIRFQNECIPSFDVDEQRAHDLIARLQMGTVEVRIGFVLEARRDWEINYCDGDEGGPELSVDLLYARLLDTERSEAEGGEVIDTYRTPRGFRLALHDESLFREGGEVALPVVEVSDLQWRGVGQEWNDEFEGAARQEATELEPELQGAIERALYPCYVRALQRNASLQGAVVLEYALDDDGGEGAEFLLDTVDDRQFRRCAAGQIGELETARRIDRIEGVGAFKATVLLRRQ